ncbi:ribonuclease Y [Acidobacteriota bacterium]
MDNPALLIAAAAVILVCFLVAFFYLKKKQARRIITSAEEQAKKRIAEANKEVEGLLKEARLTAKEELLSSKTDFEKQTKERRKELNSLERRLNQKEENLERKVNYIEHKEKEIKNREKKIQTKENDLTEQHDELKNLIRREQENLQKIAGLTIEGAKRELMKMLEEDARRESASTVKKIEEETKEQSQAKARRIIAFAIQRTASEHVVETTVSVVDLPNEEMKGRIIGREGRNIRALEMATGVDLIVDDTPEAVILSGFDPIRREIARIAIERLIQDGRIHPARIEEIVTKVRQELDQKIKEEGETAALDLGISDIHVELVKLLGKLRYRTSFGQNVLQHSIEVAKLATAMASELGVNAAVAKRAGLLHDIGKAIDREIEGTHTEIGVNIARKFRESESVIHAIAAHHGDTDPHSIEAVLIQAADTLSAARPGARREILETYLKRLEKLEEIAGSFKGVSKSFAIQAGREIRIIVESKKVNDDEAIWLSRDIAKRIENELEYPGQIKVTVIRETRAVEYAK